MSIEGDVSSAVKLSCGLCRGSPVIGVSSTGSFKWKTNTSPSTWVPSTGIARNSVWNLLHSKCMLCCWNRALHSRDWSLYSWLLKSTGHSDGGKQIDCQLHCHVGSESLYIEPRQHNIKFVLFHFLHKAKMYMFESQKGTKDHLWSIKNRKSSCYIASNALQMSFPLVEFCTLCWKGPKWISPSWLCVLHVSAAIFRVKLSQKTSMHLPLAGKQSEITNMPV